MTLDDVLKQVQKKRDLRIATLGEMEAAESISTGNLTMDWLTTVGGLPRGRITELYGLPSSGKTTIALQTAKQAMDLGLNVLFVDYEHSLDPVYAEALGIDIWNTDKKKPRFLQTQPDTLEDGINAIRSLIPTGQIGMVLVDSVAAMVPEREQKIDTGASTFAHKAQLMAQTMRQLTPVVRGNGVVCVFLNHIQDVIDSSPTGKWLAMKGVKRTTTPGGAALKFHASVRIEFVPAGSTRTMEFSSVTGEREPQVTGTNVKVTVVKNKVGPPFRSGHCRVRYGRGFSNVYSALQVLAGNAVVKVTGKTKDSAPKQWTYNFDGDVAPAWGSARIKGEEEALEALERDPEWADRLVKMAVEVLANSKPGPAPEIPEEIEQADEEELRELLGVTEEVP